MGRYTTDDDGFSDTGEASTDAEVVSEDATLDTSEVEPDEVGDEPAGEDEGTAEGAEVEDGDGAATFPVQVGGETIDVPLDELAKGYLRTADYTRKTQQLAAARRDLHDANELIGALERNPADTLRVLARHYGLGDVTEEAGQPRYEEAPPEVVQLHELQAWKSQMETQQREALVDAELARLHSTYGDFENEELFGYAVQHGIQNLETAYRAMHYGSNGKPKVDKRKVAGQMAGNGHRANVVPKAPPERISSFHDAYQAAKRELGRT
jgi:hypothetical protein